MKRLKQMVCLCLANSFMVLSVFAAPVAAMQAEPVLMASSDAVSIAEESTDVNESKIDRDLYGEDASSAETGQTEMSDAAEESSSDRDRVQKDMSVADDMEQDGEDSDTSEIEINISSDEKLESSSDSEDATMEAQPLVYAADGESTMPEDSGTSGVVGGRLDGDYAYISDAGLVAEQSTTSGYAISTGTSPWDENSTEPGNDATEKDEVVRSFDIVSYTTWFRSKMRGDAPYSVYETGTLHFEFILPGDASGVQFEESAMGWLNAKKEATYTITETTYNGQVCQILRGSYLWEPSKDNPSAIGESYQELNVVLRVLAMHNGQKIQPLFTYWLEGNEVSSDDIVTGSGLLCSEHQEVEYKTITPPDITVTAAPRYNIQLKAGDTRASYIGSFDFSTGNAYAMNPDAQDVYGRISVLGITIQLMGKDAEHGLRGCELPDGKELTFTLQLSDTYLGNDGMTHDTTDTYTPLVWSLEGNDKNDHTKQQYDEREITGKYKLAAGGAPFNKLEGYEYSSCADGGIWTGTQQGNTVSITVSRYTVDLNQLPYTDANTNASRVIYYDPNTVKNYWDIQTACFSAGELWVVQPFFTADNRYVVDQYDTGTFNLTVTDSDLSICTVSGQTGQLQEKTTDDQLVLALELEKPGDIDHSVTYQKYGEVGYGSALTDGCYEDGKDWIVAGGQLGIQEMLKHNTAEGMNTGTAYDDLVKFDDAFFAIEGILSGSSAGLENMTQTFLYGAKPDKSGWDHAGLEPGEAGYDTEMMDATADDLVFFTTLKELQDAEYTCVAVLWEARGVASPQSTNCYFSLQGYVADTAKSNCVYMVTHSAQAWNKANVQTEVAVYFGVEPAALTDEQYAEYMKTVFPSRADGKEYSYTGDYPEAFWVNNTETDSGLASYIKSAYDGNGYTGGSAGVSYGDSCLVVSYASHITKKVMQTNSSGADKLSYDIDANQRIADYALHLSVQRTAGESNTEGAQTMTDLYVEDILPQGLTYISGSACWGGSYQQTGEGQQGMISGGISMEPDITANTDGTTTLRWTLSNVKVTNEEVTVFDSIYYSCRIGTPKNEDTDVKNNDQLLNQALIWGSAEQKRDFNAVNGNLAEMSIQVSKNNAVSLSKTTKTPTIEQGESMQFTLNIGNNAVNTMQMVAVDSLPYDRDTAGSLFKGSCLVKSLTVMTPELLDKITLYYTTKESERGKTSTVYSVNDFADSFVWQKLTVDPVTNTAMLPEGEFAPVAIAAVGQLPSQQTFKVDLTMELPYGQVGDRVINRLSCGDLETGSTVEVTGEPPYTGTDFSAKAWPVLAGAACLVLLSVGGKMVCRRKRGSR